MLFGVIYRPVVDFEIKTRFCWIPVLAYADSGADITLLPRSFLYFLDVKFTEREVELNVSDKGIRAKAAITTTTSEGHYFETRCG